MPDERRVLTCYAQNLQTNSNMQTVWMVCSPVQGLSFFPAMMQWLTTSQGHAGEGHLRKQEQRSQKPGQTLPQRIVQLNGNVSANAHANRHRRLGHVKSSP